MYSKNHLSALLFRTVKVIMIYFTISLLSIPLHAQISHGGEPASFRLQQFVDKEISYTPKTAFSMAKSDKIEKQCTAYEFGKVLPFNHYLKDPDFGSHTIDHNGNLIWKATIASENALALGLYFSDFYLPKGAELFIYSPDRSQMIGSFTDLNNSETGLFATELIFGDKLIIEYNEPASVAGLGRFKIEEVLHAYRGVSDLKNSNGFGGSGNCEVNINCSEGADWENPKNSVVRLLIKEGSSTYWCTGSVINNVNNDYTPYILTADHCAVDASSADLNQWIVYFNYQSDNCDNPSVEPALKSMTGASKIAASSNAGILGSDFYLVLLNENIPEEYNPYFAGWDRSGITSNSGVSIHHPEGDLKKISTYTSPLLSTTYSNGGFVGLTNGSWEVAWSETANGHGVTEGGSSGAPIYSQSGYLIGTLTGGWASCSSLSEPDFFGKFKFHWDQNGTSTDTQLKPWLDPNNTGVEFIPGIPEGKEEFIEVTEGLFILFPNPSNGKITLRVNESVYGETFSIRVSNMLGQYVYNDKHTIYYQSNINLQHLQNGVYFIEVEGKNQHQTRKISISY